MTYSTTDLLSRIRLKATLDGSESSYTDSILLDLASQVIVEQILPIILKLNGDYYLTYTDIPLIAGRDAYPIPPRAAFQKVHSIDLLDSAKTYGSSLYYTDYRNIPVTSSGAPYNHIFRDNSIVVSDNPSVSSGYLRVRYPYTPSQLVALSAVTEITGGESTGVLTGVVPATWTTANRYDIVSGQSPFELIHSDLTASSVVSATSITFALSDLNVNRLSDGGTYFVCLSGETAYPMIPKELHYCLADLAACPVLQLCGDEGWSEFYSEAHSRLTTLLNSLITRKTTESAPWVRTSSILPYFA